MDSVGAREKIERHKHTNMNGWMNEQRKKNSGENTDKVDWFTEREIVKRLREMRIALSKKTAAAAAAATESFVER